MSVTFSCGGDAECNFANENARSILQMLELECRAGGFELSGEVPPEDLPAVLRCITRFKNVEKLRKPFLRTTVSEGRVTLCGTDDESIMYRLGAMAGVVMEGIKTEQPLTWS